MTPFPPEPLRMDSPMTNPLLLPPLTLAYVGDAVYSLFVRKRILERGAVRVGDLHKASVSYVQARRQAEALQQLLPSLTEEEQDVVRRGRNAKSHAPPKGASAAEYQASTAFETLLGFLYLAGREERLAEVLSEAARFLEAEGNGT
jgi:ribonuclease-3 family protein